MNEIRRLPTYVSAPAAISAGLRQWVVFGQTLASGLECPGR